MNRTRNYKTVKGLVQQSYYNRLSVSNVISGHFFRKSLEWSKLKLSDEGLKEFVYGICDALNMRDKEDVLYNIKHHRIEDCGILERVQVTKYKGKLHYEYIAGQCYPSEARFVRKLLRCK